MSFRKIIILKVWALFQNLIKMGKFSGLGSWTGESQHHQRTFEHTHFFSGPRWRAHFDRESKIVKNLLFFKNQKGKTIQKKRDFTQERIKAKKFKLDSPPLCSKQRPFVLFLVILTRFFAWREKNFLPVFWAAWICATFPTGFWIATFRKSEKGKERTENIRENFRWVEMSWSMREFLGRSENSFFIEIARDWITDR